MDLSSHRRSFNEKRSAAKTLIAQGKGHPSRPSGAFSVPTDGMAEPGRTERILKHPFALCHPVAGDAFQARLGFLFFRVNGLTAIGIAYRLIILS